MNLHDRDVFVFVNAARNRMKILHCEEGDLVLYSLRIEIGRIRMSFSGESDGIAGALGYESLSSATKSVMESHMSRGQTVFTEDSKNEIETGKIVR